MKRQGGGGNDRGGDGVEERSVEEMVGTEREVIEEGEGQRDDIKRVEEEREMRGGR